MKNVLVTGCSSGIGRCIADGLQQRGYRVFATARRQDAIDSLTAAGIEALSLDLNDSDAIKNCIDTLLDKTGNDIYGLVNNAAYGQAGAIEDLSRAALTQQFQTNVFGTQELTNLLIPVMRERNAGRIVQIGSLLGFITMRFRGAYCASKYALESLSDAMRYELQDTNIHVSIIQPGPICSDFRSNMLSNYQSTIVKQNSVFKDDYAKIEREMNAEDYSVPFTLGPKAVLKKTVHTEANSARYHAGWHTRKAVRITPGLAR